MFQYFLNETKFLKFKRYFVIFINVIKIQQIYEWINTDTYCLLVNISHFCKNVKKQNGTTNGPTRKRSVRGNVYNLLLKVSFEKFKHSVTINTNINGTILMLQYLSILKPWLKMITKDKQQQTMPLIIAMLLRK